MNDFIGYRQPASVLFCGGSLIDDSSGPFHSMKQTVKALIENGHLISVVGTRGRSDILARDWPGDVHAFRRRGPYSLHYAPELADWLSSCSSGWDVASMQGVWMHTNRAVFDWCVKNNRPYMITVHGNFNSAALKISTWKKFLASKSFMRPVFENAACYQALTDIEYNVIREHGVRDPICVIGNGINLPDTSISFDLTEIIDRKYLKRRTCLYLGRLFHIKGVDRLLRAWGRISPGDDWQLIIAGGGDVRYIAELKDIASKAGCRNVSFVGHVSGLVKEAWFRQAEFFVLPSHSEAFPMAVLEAFSYNCPALITVACGLPEAAELGAAIEVSSSEEGIADGLKSMLNLGVVDLVEMGNAAHRMVSSRYTWKIVTEKLTTVYEWIRGNVPVPDCVRNT